MMWIRHDYTINYDIDQRCSREEKYYMTCMCWGNKLWGKFHVLQNNNVNINRIYISMKWKELWNKVYVKKKCYMKVFVCDQSILKMEGRICIVMS